MGFLEEFKRAYVGDDTQHYQVVGKEVRCPHCEGNNFDGASSSNVRHDTSSKSS